MWRNSYKARLKAEGNNVVEAVKQTTKNSNIQQILDSPTRVDVALNDNELLYPCIVSDIKTFKKRRFLFMPDTEINVGDYVHHEGYTYLATDKTTSDTYPQLIGEVCNSTFTLKEPDIEIDTGEVDFLNRPIYETIEGESREIPCIFAMNTASVSVADNNQPVNLLDNKAYIKIPYIESETIQYDETFDSYGFTYRIIRIDLSNVINGIGYLEITGELIEEAKQ